MIKCVDISKENVVHCEPDFRATFETPDGRKFHVLIPHWVIDEPEFFQDGVTKKFMSGVTEGEEFGLNLVTHGHYS